MASTDGRVSSASACNRQLTSLGSDGDTTDGSTRSLGIVSARLERVRSGGIVAGCCFGKDENEGFLAAGCNFCGGGGVYACQPLTLNGFDILVKIYVAG